MQPSPLYHPFINIIKYQASRQYGRTRPNDRIHTDYSISVKRNNSSEVAPERIWILG